MLKIYVLAFDLACVADGLLVVGMHGAREGGGETTFDLPVLHHFRTIFANTFCETCVCIGAVQVHQRSSIARLLSGFCRNLMVWLGFLNILRIPIKYKCMLQMLQHRFCHVILTRFNIPLNGTGQCQL